MHSYCNLHSYWVWCVLNQSGHRYRSYGGAHKPSNGRWRLTASLTAIKIALWRLRRLIDLDPSSSFVSSYTTSLFSLLSESWDPYQASNWNGDWLDHMRTRLLVDHDSEVWWDFQLVTTACNYRTRQPLTNIDHTATFLWLTLHTKVLQWLPHTCSFLVNSMRQPL